MIAALLFAVVVGTDAPLADAKEEARAQSLMREIRCVVCENEPVSHSTADIAVDMRRTIRQQVDAGASDQQVRDFFSERYGDFVLFRPPTTGPAILIWLFPFTLLAAAAFWLFARARGGKGRKLEPLPDDSPEAGA
jgi:cytochrome c-type biogenesis protein CcmH